MKRNASGTKESKSHVTLFNLLTLQRRILKLGQKMEIFARRPMGIPSYVLLTASLLCSRRHPQELKYDGTVLRLITKMTNFSPM